MSLPSCLVTFLLDPHKIIHSIRPEDTEVTLTGRASRTVRQYEYFRINGRTEQYGQGRIKVLAIHPDDPLRLSD
jgi:hypothetical protein